MLTKHYYFVSGLDSHGDKFAGSCVAGDIINAINLFRNICCSVHEIKMGVQARADHDERITMMNGIEYTTIIARSGRKNWVAEGETEIRPREPYPEFIGRRLRDIILERLPSAATDICHGGVAGCPSDYSYFNRTYDCTPDHTAHDNCSHESCTACWNQVYVGKDKEGNW